VRALKAKADALGLQAETTQDIRTALLAVREMTRLVELQARLALEATAGRASDVSEHPVWHELSACIMQAIQPCAECTHRVRSVVLEKLGVVDTPGVCT
jgi:hypothetical protein